MKPEPRKYPTLNKVFFNGTFKGQVKSRFLRGSYAMLLLFVLFAAGAAQNCLAEPMDWASESQKDFASRLASAFGSTEICDLDINPDRVADLLREKFGERLTARAVSDLMYMVVVMRAVQGVQVRGLKESEIKERCALMLQHFGGNGTDLRGVLR